MTSLKLGQRRSALSKGIGVLGCVVGNRKGKCLREKVVLEEGLVSDLMVI